MPKINLATVTSPLNSTEFQRQINENFTKVSESLDKQLQRESQNGVVNYMEDVIDMGSNRIINLAKAVDPTDAMRKKEFDDATANIEQWAEEAKTSAANAKISETNAESAKVIAVSAANSAQDHEEDCQTILDSVETLKEEIITNPSVETVAESITDVNIVAGRIDDVSSVAENVETVVDAKNKVIDLATRISFGNLGDVQATTSLIAPKGCEFLDGHVITKDKYPQAFIALEEGRLPSRSTAEYKAAAGTVSGEIFTPENAYPFFGYDAGSSTAYLPIAWDIFIEASDVHADIVEPGLPDHTHNMFANITIGSDGNLASSAVQVAKGTSSGNGNYEYTLKQTDTAATLGQTSLASGSVYGGSTTVQPHALRYRHYIVLAEGATLAYTNRPSVATYSALPTTGNVLGDLRGVLDTNISYVWVKFGENQYGWSSLGYGIGVTEQRLQETVGDIETALASV